MEVFVARQPILNRSAQLEAYELLYRGGDSQTAFDGTESSSATMQVISNTILSFGLDSMLGGKKAFLNFDRTLLTNGTQELLPPDVMAVEILETVEPDADVIAACAELHKQGYTLALDDFKMGPRTEVLVPFAKIIKVDLRDTDQKEVERIVQLYHPRGITMLAEKVETKEEFEWARRTGFDMFQGYFFARPLLVRRQQISTDEITCLLLLNELQHAEINCAKVHALVCRDAALCYKLLRYANSGLFNFRVYIRSIQHAIAIIGEHGIRHWIALAAIPGLVKDKPKELITHTLVRARFCERLAELAAMPESGRAFLMGILSLIDVLLGMPLDEALLQVSVDARISRALLGTAPEGDVFRVIHTLVVRYEEGAWDFVDALMRKLQMKASAIAEAYADSLLWAQQSLRN